MPTAIKDLFDFKPGWPATFGGIRALRDHRLDGLLRCGPSACERAGAIIVGKTNSPVLGFRGTTRQLAVRADPQPVRPRAQQRRLLGRRAAAVADGLLPIAEATDGGGSIRIPASCCGLYGFKASFGRVPLVGGPNAFGGATPVPASRAC